MRLIRNWSLLELYYSFHRSSSLPEEIMKCLKLSISEFLHWFLKEKSLVLLFELRKLSDEDSDTRMFRHRRFHFGISVIRILIEFDSICLSTIRSTFFHCNISSTIVERIELIRLPKSLQNFLFEMVCHLCVQQIWD